MSVVRPRQRFSLVVSVCQGPYQQQLGERSFLDDSELTRIGLNTVDIPGTKSFAIERGSKITEVADVFGGASGALRARHWRISKPD